MALPLAKPAPDRPRFGQPGYDMAADLAALQEQLEATGHSRRSRIYSVAVPVEQEQDPEDCEPTALELWRDERTYG